MAHVIDADPSEAMGRECFVNAVRSAVDQKAWERVAVDPNTFSWENVAKQWIEIFGLNEGVECRRTNSMSA